MAAVTADPLTLPRVATAALGDTERPVVSVTTGPTGLEGEGFPVRRTMARVFPNLFATHRVRAVGDYSSHLLRALRASAAPNEADPTVVVLTPGVANSAYFEHTIS